MAAWQRRPIHRPTDVHTFSTDRWHNEDEYEDEFDEIDDEYLNADDIEAVREQKLWRGKDNMNEGIGFSNSSSLPNMNIASQHDRYMQMNNNRKVAPAPPPKKPNKNNKPNEYIQLENSDTEDGSTTRSTPGARSAADLFDRRQAHSDVEVQRAPHPQIQWLQMNNETHNKKAASLPTGASPISPRQNFSFPGQRSPAFRSSPVPDEVYRNIDEDRPPSTQAPPPPVNRQIQNKLVTSSSSGLGASGPSSPPHSPVQRGQQKSPHQHGKTHKSKQENLTRFSWYKESMSREEAEKKVRAYGENGSFVVRDCRNAGHDKPFVMSILCRREIFHVPIRRRTKDSYYAVGDEKLDELRFETVEDVIKHFHLNPIDLVPDTRKRADSFRVELRYRTS